VDTFTVVASPSTSGDHDDFDNDNDGDEPADCFTATV
jgi:hypothetical protein